MRLERLPAWPRLSALPRGPRATLSTGGQPSARPPSWKTSFLTPGNGHRDAAEVRQIQRDGVTDSGSPTMANGIHILLISLLGFPPGTSSVDQSGLKRDPRASAFQVLGSKMHPVCEEPDEA